MMRTTTTLRSALVAALLLLGLGACGTDDTVIEGSATSTTEAAAPETTNPDESSSQEPGNQNEDNDSTSDGGREDTPPSPEPPPVIVTRGADTVALDAWTYCWTPAGIEDGICADALPPAEPPRVGGDGPIILSFAADFTFSAQTYDPGYGEITGDVAITPVDGGWELTPSVEGPSIIEVFGKGAEGDVSVSFAID